jgi:DNA/RNA endonuclease YhcR with UshA esterase domain
MKGIAGLAVGLLIATSPASAHHSFAAEYDGDRPVTVSGTVARIDWSNPHIHFYLDVKDDNGTLTQWKFEGYPPNMLVRQGWKKDETLKPGDVVTVSGWRSRLETNGAASRLVTFADGRKMQSGPPAGTGGQ